MACCTRKLYRSDNRMIFGVCQGFAEHFDLPVVWIRLGVLVLTLITMPVVLIGYFVVALILKPKPENAAGDSPYGDTFYDGSAASRTDSLRAMKSKFDSIEARIRRMENYVTNKSFDWERRFRSGE